jgi:pimeloyl-ACP methyl ester carboxylesterase
MSLRHRSPEHRLVAAFVVAVLLAGCAAMPERAPPIEPKAGERTVLRTARIDRALEERILALDPTRVSERDVADVLGQGPAPTIMLVHGGIYPVHLAMASFGEFLTGMGYPEAKIREPHAGEWSYSPYSSTDRLAGILAWHYEQDGMRPMLVGHSQGGLYVVKILKELAGQKSQRLAVWNPVTDEAEQRSMIVDPLTDRERPVVGLSVSYASVLGAGGWALVLPNQWDDFANLRRIPDTVVEFTGYFIELDLFALSFPGNPFDVPYETNGAATVRNVTLPATYNHVFVPVTDELPQNPSVRKWLNDYTPGQDSGVAEPPEGAGGGALWAADVWYSVKKHWVLEAQRFVRARRALADGLK